MRVTYRLFTNIRKFDRVVGQKNVKQNKKVDWKVDFFSNVFLTYFNNSITPAAPCPVPTHIVTIPYFLLRRRNSLIN